MAITFQQTRYSGKVSPFWRKEVKVLPGGFQIGGTVANGDIIAEGSFVSVDFATMTAHLVKIGKVLGGGTTTAPRVSKNNNFAVGDVLMKLGTTTSKTITAIDRSNDGYDVITLNSAYSGLTEGDILQEAVVAESTASPKHVANGVVSDTKTITDRGLMALDVAYDCALINGIAQPVPASWLVPNGFALAANPNILIINQ